MRQPGSNNTRWTPGHRSPRHADILAETGCIATVAEFREILIAVKAERYPDLTDEDLAFTRDQAGDYCAEFNRRLGGAKLPRAFILKVPGRDQEAEGGRRHRRPEA